HHNQPQKKITHQQKLTHLTLQLITIQQHKPNQQNNQHHPPQQPHNIKKQPHQSNNQQTNPIQNHQIQLIKLHHHQPITTGGGIAVAG
ncbi:hypothetical protein DF186_17640, partial [Enterococcus hirae]